MTLEEFLSVCRDFDGRQPSPTLRRATDAFLGQAGQDSSLLQRGAEALPSLDPVPASWLALVLGSAVERGGDVELTGPALVALLRSWLPRLPGSSRPDTEGADTSRPAPTPEQLPFLRALPMLCQALVAHLARMPERREELAHDSGLLDRLEELEDYSHGAAWVRSALRRGSGSLVVLHPPSGKGLQLHYWNVETCFHLFSLIQAKVGERIPGGQTPDPDIADAATGQSDDSVTDHAWWHYGDPRSPTANIAASIWGEENVRSIPSVNGEQVLLLWPPLLGSRSWDSSFFGPPLDALPPRIIILKELSPEESQRWFEDLGMTPARR